MKKGTNRKARLESAGQKQSSSKDELYEPHQSLASSTCSFTRRSKFSPTPKSQCLHLPRL